MIGYIMIGTADLERATTYYDAVLAPLGLVRIEDEDTSLVGYAPTTAKDQIEFYVAKPFNGEPATAGNGTMIALLAESRAAVNQFHKIALENGAIDEGAPGSRPTASDPYYAYARDHDGNKICAYTNAAP